jgi:magnesium transporter
MVRVEVIAYTPTEFLEEYDVTIARCRELLETHAVTWVNVVDPDPGTVEELETRFGLHPLALEDAQNQDLAPKVELYDTTVFIVARTIVWTEELDTDQLSVFVAGKFLVTIHDKVFPQLEATRIRVRKRDPRILKSGPDFLAYTILDDLVDSYLPHLDRLQNILDELEEKALEDPSRETANTIHRFRRDLLVLRNQLRPQRDAFAQLSRTDLVVFRKETRNYLRDIYDHMIQALDRIDTLREVSSGLMEVYLSVVNNSLNEVMKTLTIIATVFLPLGLIASAYGMNVAFPGKEQWTGLLFALVLMAFVGAVMVMFFRRRKWL